MTSSPLWGPSAEAWPDRPQQALWEQCASPQCGTPAGELRSRPSQPPQQEGSSGKDTPGHNWGAVTHAGVSSGNTAV